jgi:hypothetical protein
LLPESWKSDVSLSSRIIYTYVCVFVCVCVCVCVLSRVSD